MSPTDRSDLLAAFSEGHEDAFTVLVEPHRRELRVHCYRMLGSFDEAEDLVQETLLRAWKNRQGFEARSSVRSWLYRIATNACLDALDRRKRVVAVRAAVQARDATVERGLELDLPWLQPFPDHLLESAGPSDAEPESRVVAKETIELAFIIAIQHLTPRQRATFIARDVLDWPAAETASVLEMSVASVNSALQRARGTLRRLVPPQRTEWKASSEPSDEERTVLERYVDAAERGDMDALAALLRDDARFAMPPEPSIVVGRQSIIESWTPFMSGPTVMGTWKLIPTWANRQPAAANYVRRRGEDRFRGLAIDVLRVERGMVTDVLAFDARMFPAFGLPLTLPADKVPSARSPREQP